MSLRPLIALIGLLLLAGTPARGADGGPELKSAPPETARLREPVAMALADDGATLLVGNRQSGSLSVVDLKAGKCIAEFDLGGRLSGFAVLPNQAHLLAIDESRHELIGLTRTAEGFRVRVRLPVSEFPASVVVTPDGNRCTLASLWSRTVTVVDNSAIGRDAEEPSFRVLHEVSLPFAPREQMLLPGGTRLIAADAFGGFLAVVDLENGSLESVREIPGHNIRGLALSHDGRHVFVSHQTLNPLARTEQSDLHWGLLVSGSVRVLSLHAVLDPEADLLERSWSIRPGDTGRGAGDPEGILVLGDERVLVAAGGAGEVLDVSLRGAIRRVPIGGRPTTLLPSADGNAVYVASAFSDSISVLDPARMEIVRKIGLGPVPDLSPVDRGKRLFYDAGLSHGGWFSCHSCHTDGHSNGRLADTLGDGSYGDPKRVLPLGGIGETGPWAWNGQVSRLEDQIESSIRKTMQGEALSAEKTSDLVAYLNSIPPAPPTAGKTLEGDLVERGRDLFGELRCNVCHVPPTYTSPAAYEVGLTDKAGGRRFNPPSLRGLGQRPSYFHDGRASSLREVLSKYRHQLDRDLSEQQYLELLEFLMTL